MMARVFKPKMALPRLCLIHSPLCLIHDSIVPCSRPLYLIHDPIVPCSRPLVYTLFTTPLCPPVSCSCVQVGRVVMLWTVARVVWGLSALTAVVEFQRLVGSATSFREQVNAAAKGGSVGKATDGGGGGRRDCLFFQGQPERPFVSLPNVLDP